MEKLYIRGAHSDYSSGDPGSLYSYVNFGNVNCKPFILTWPTGIPTAVLK
jgi:3-methyladenine DNA glycosylase Mpg